MAESSTSVTLENYEAECITKFKKEAQRVIDNYYAIAMNDLDEKYGEITLSAVKFEPIVEEPDYWKSRYVEKKTFDIRAGGLTRNAYEALEAYATSLRSGVISEAKAFDYHTGGAPAANRCMTLETRWGVFLVSVVVQFNQGENNQKICDELMVSLGRIEKM